VRILLVDDDQTVRVLLRTTFESADVEVDEAASAAEAAERIAVRMPDVLLLDVHMPVMDGIEFARNLKADRRTRDLPIVMLTGVENGTGDAARDAGAAALIRKPFSPLELLAVVERVAGGLHAIPFRATKAKGPQEELLLYARDLRHILELERGQRALLQDAYLETVTALASALETKDTGTKEHSQRVQRYAVELYDTMDPRRLHKQQSVQYGFLLHDVGKIGIPDSILQKPGPLTRAERQRMQTHTVLGEQMLGGVAFLQGEGLHIVRSHHERWDGKGYPDGIRGEAIPLGARIFAVADSLDAMTSDRPYRAAMPWKEAREEIMREAGRQFDPDVVTAFRQREDDLKEIHREITAAAA
jgi:response regulator RpfG family c-di-GMP phosphodiesterase